MKITQSVCINMCSKESYDNYGLSEKLEILIILPITENIAANEYTKIYNDIINIAENKIREFTASSRYNKNPGTALIFTDCKITKLLTEALASYNVRINVNQFL